MISGYQGGQYHYQVPVSEAARLSTGGNMAVRSFGGKTPQCGAGVWVDPSAQVIGVEPLGEDCSVWPGAVIRADMHFIEIGARVVVQDNQVLHNPHEFPFNHDGLELTLGDDVTAVHQPLLMA